MQTSPNRRRRRTSLKPRGSPKNMLRPVTRSQAPAPAKTSHSATPRSSSAIPLNSMPVPDPWESDNRGVPTPSSDDAFAEVKAKVDLVKVVQEQVRLTKRNKDFWGLCPFHQAVSYTHLRAHETRHDLVCRL